MKRKSKAASRMSSAQMHALAAVRQEIGSRDSARSCKYLRDFSDSFLNYDRALSTDELDRRLNAASMVLVGDYHALPASQHFAASLVEQIAQRSSVVLGVEAVLSRDQRLLDAWWRREIGEGELRQRLGFDREWGYGWKPFYDLLTSAREHGLAIYGLDCMPRDDLRSIRSRDRHAAAKIREMREKHPGSVILVVFGESHMAPAHLPASIGKVLPQERTLTVLQNLDSLYWTAIGEHAAAVSMADDAVCVFNASPLEKQENYRLCLERWNAAADEPTDFAPAVYNLIFSLARCLGFRLDSHRNGTQPKYLADSLPEVVTIEQSSEDLFAPAGLAAELVGQGPMRQRLQQVRSRLARRLEELDCVYVEATNRIYVREFQLVHVAAEATRFLHCVCAGITLPCSPEADAVQNALAHFGSRLLCPGNTVTTDETGEALYQAYLADRIKKGGIRQIFLAPLHERIVAQKTLRALQQFVEH